MKKLLLTTTFILASVILFICCTFASPLERLTALANEVELNHESYTDKNWEEVATKCLELEKEFKEVEHTQEEFKEFGRQQGRINGYMAKYTIKNWGREIEDFANELEGNIEGFLNAIGGMAEE